MIETSELMMRASAVIQDSIHMTLINFGADVQKEIDKQLELEKSDDKRFHEGVRVGMTHVMVRMGNLKFK
jgi:hypothetical protein